MEIDEKNVQTMETYAGLMEVQEDEVADGAEKESESTESKGIKKRLNYRL